MVFGWQHLVSVGHDCMQIKHLNPSLSFKIEQFLEPQAYSACNDEPVYL